MRSEAPQTGDGWERMALSALGLLVLALSLVSVRDGLRLVGAPSPQLFVDPFGRFSSVSLPSWPEVSPSLLYTDQLVALEGVPLPARELIRGRGGALLAAHCVRAQAARRASVTLTFRRGDVLLHATRALRPLSFSDAVFFLLLNHGVSSLALWAAVAVHYFSPRRRGGRAFIFWSSGVAFFLSTFTDYHTSARFHPLFNLGSGWLLAGMASVIYAFPDAPTRGGGRARQLWGATVGATAAVTAVAVAAPWLGYDAFAARNTLGLGVLASLVVLMVVLYVRYHLAVGRQREELWTAGRGIGVALGVILLGFGFLTVTGAATIHFFLPIVTSFIPLFVGWALVQHNILGANTVLTQRLLAYPTVLIAGSISTGAWLAFRKDGGHGADSSLATMAGAVTFAGLLAAFRRLSTRLLFPAAAAFRPTIEQLAESLADPAQAVNLPAALERTVHRWLPTSQARLLKPPALAEIDHLPGDASARLGQGEKLWTEQSPWERHLVVPLRSHGELRGVLDIAPKHQGALFTEEDLALLDTIAALGAIALHNAEILAALDDARRMEVDATREDKRLTLGTLGAELSHEIAHPLSFFRTLLRRAARRPIDGEDVEIGEEEIARMDRMLQSLRRLEVPPPRIASVPLRDPVARALALARERLGERKLLGEVDLPAGCVVQADADGLVQVFANLLRNAAQAARGAVGVRATAADDGSLAIDVWDDGPGVPEELVPKLFQRWVTSRSVEGGSGLGLSVAQQIVVNFGWKILYLRDGGRTCFRVVVPEDKVRFEAG